MRTVIVPVAASILTACTSAPYALRDMGSFHVGGRDVEITGKPVKEVVFTPGGVPAKVDLNGTYSVEAMYVQYFLPANRRGAVPLLMWHGGGLTGVTYETTPDGREGWLNYFVKQGWDVYNSDAVERGRAGWAMFPDIFKGEPVFLAKANPFERFRIGQGAGSYSPDPAKQKLMPASQFPVEAYDNFVKQNVPRWTTTDDAIIRAYIALVDKVCPCVIDHHRRRDHPRLHRAGRQGVPVRDPLSLAGGAVRLQGGAGAARQGQSARRGRARRCRRREAGGGSQEHSDARRLRRQHRARLALAADPQERPRVRGRDLESGRQGGDPRPAEGRNPRQLAHADDGQEQPAGRRPHSGLAGEAGAVSRGYRGERERLGRRNAWKSL